MAEGVEADVETIEEEEDMEAPHGGAAGEAPTVTTSTTVARKTVTTKNCYEEVIRKAETAMNAKKQDTSREIIQSDKIGVEMVTEMGVEMEMGAEMEMEVEMEVEMEAEVDTTATAMELVTDMKTVDSKVKAMELVLEMEVKPDSTVKASEEILDPEVKDSVKETDTTDRSCLEMAPTICNDSPGRPPSIRR
jgi:hypothetical protein